MFSKKGRLFRKWQFNANSSIFTSPAVSQRIAVATKDGRVMMLDAQGKALWEHKSAAASSKVSAMFLEKGGQDAIYSTPALYDIDGDGNKEVLVGSDSGRVLALTHEGQLMWHFKAGAPVRGKVVFHDGYIVFGSMDNFLYILDRTGKRILKIDSKSPIESTPACYGDKIIFGTNNGYLHCVTFNGKQVWSFKTEGSITAEPTIAELYHRQNYVLVGSTDNNLYCLSMAGELVWRFETEGRILSKAVVKDVNKDGDMEIFFGSCDNNVYALKADGKLLWSYETDFWVVASPIVADIDGDGNLEVIAGSYDNVLYVLDAEGSYILDYMPGISGIAYQSGHYTNILTSDPGELVGKKIWEFKTEGIITGSALLDNDIIVATKPGFIDNIAYKEV